MAVAAAKVADATTTAASTLIVALLPLALVFFSGIVDLLLSFTASPVGAMSRSGKMRELLVFVQKFQIGQEDTEDNGGNSQDEEQLPACPWLRGRSAPGGRRLASGPQVAPAGPFYARGLLECCSAWHKSKPSTSSLLNQRRPHLIAAFQPAFLTGWLPFEVWSRSYHPLERMK